MDVRVVEISFLMNKHIKANKIQTRIRAMFLKGVAPDNKEQHSYIKMGDGFSRSVDRFELPSFDRERRRM
jgi:hypothetical protein